MISRRLLASGVAALAAGVWVPKLFLSKDPEKKTTGGAGEALLIGGSHSEGDGDGDEGAALLFNEREDADGASSGPQGDRFESLERTLLAMESFLPTRQGERLDRLASQWAGTASEAGPGEVSAPNYGGYGGHGGTSRAGAPTDSRSRTGRASPDASAIDDFLAANPLHAVACGPSQARALFGNRLARTGDELVAGLLAVESIEPRRVVLRAASRSFAVELAPFRPGFSGASTPSVEPVASRESGAELYVETPTSPPPDSPSALKEATPPGNTDAALGST